MEQEQHGIVEVHGPANIWGRISGINTQGFFLFLIVCMQAVLVYMIVQSDRDREIRYIGLQQQLRLTEENDKLLRTNQDMFKKVVESVVEEQKVTTYVLTLSDTERKGLRLTMPESLKGRQRGRQD